MFKAVELLVLIAPIVARKAGVTTEKGMCDTKITDIGATIATFLQIIIQTYHPHRLLFRAVTTMSCRVIPMILVKQR